MKVYVKCGTPLDPKATLFGPKCTGELILDSGGRQFMPGEIKEFLTQFYNEHNHAVDGIVKDLVDHTVEMTAGGVDEGVELTFTPIEGVLYEDKGDEPADILGVLKPLSDPDDDDAQPHLPMEDE